MITIYILVLWLRCLNDFWWEHFFKFNFRHFTVGTLTMIMLTINIQQVNVEAIREPIYIGSIFQ